MATAVPMTTLSATIGPVFTNIISEQPKWSEKVGGVNQLSAENKAQAQKDYDSYLQTETTTRMNRYPELGNYVTARQSMSEDLRTAKLAINEYMRGEQTLGGALAAARNSDPTKLYFEVHKHLKGLNQNSPEYAYLNKLDKPLREDMLTAEAKRLKPGAWQLANGLAALNPEQRKAAEAAYEAMKGRINSKSEITLEKFVVRAQADVARRRVEKSAEQTFEYRALPDSHWMKQQGGYVNLNNNQKNAAEKAFKAASVKDKRLAEKTIDDFVQQRQDARAVNDAAIAKVAYIFGNPEEAKRSLQGVYGKDAGAKFFESVVNSAEEGKVKTANVLETFQLATEKLDGSVKLTAIPKPGKAEEMRKLITEGRQIEAPAQEKEGPAPTSGSRQKSQRRSRERSHSR